VVAVIGGPVEFIALIAIVHGVLCLVPGDVDKCERLAHDKYALSIAGSI